jgi:hypothetical protein
MKLHYLAALLLVFSGMAFNANAETKVCSQSDAIKAEQGIDGTSITLDRQELPSLGFVAGGK